MASDAYVPPDISSFMGLIDTFLRWKSVVNKKDRLYHRYHPSEWGHCLRKQQYMHYVQLGHIPSPPFEGNPGQKERIFDVGHTMHHRWQNEYFAEMGILRGRWKCKNLQCRPEGSIVHGLDNSLGCFRPAKCECGCTKFHYVEIPVVSEEMNMSGHADLVLDFSTFDPERFGGVRKTFNESAFPKKPIVVDMKTINDWSYKQQLQKLGAHKEYIVQLTIYAHLLDCEYGILLYENKNDSSLIPFKVNRNDEIFGTVKQQAILMKALAEKKLLPPPKPLSKEERECSQCQFSTMCHASAIWNDKDLDRKRKLFYRNLL